MSPKSYFLSIWDLVLKKRPIWVGFGAPWGSKSGPKVIQKWSKSHPKTIKIWDKKSMSKKSRSWDHFARPRVPPETKNHEKPVVFLCFWRIDFFEKVSSRERKMTQMSSKVTPKEVQKREKREPKPSLKKHEKVWFS